MRNLLKNRRAWLGLAVSAVAIAVAVRGVRWPDLAAALAGAHYVWLVPALGMVVLGQLARTRRWQSLFAADGRPGFRIAFDILNVGYMVSAVFPLRLGDPVRAWLIDTRTEVRGSSALATVMVERAIDLLMVMALLALIVPEPAARLLGGSLGPGPWSAASQLGLITFVMIMGVYVGLWIVSTLGRRAGRLTGDALRRLGFASALAERAGGLVTGFADGFAPLRSPRTALLAIGWTLVVWMIGGLETWWMFRAFEIDLPFAAAVFMLGTTALAAILPSSPGYFGVFHSAVVVALGAYGVPQATALGYALVLHAATMVVLVGMGIWSLWRLGISRQDLSEHLQGG